MQSNNQHKLNASVVDKTNIAIVLKAQDQQKGNEQETNSEATLMNTQMAFPGGWIKYRKSGYQGL